jgi:uncharacterized protein YbbC (DUF1343 family)
MSAGRTAHVRLGSEVLLSSHRLNGMVVGIVCNHASLGHGYHHVLDALSDTRSAQLGAIFGPQHGFRSDVQDNMVETPHGVDSRTRVPIYSLYSDTREPTPEMMQGLHALVIDLQDIGARIYTYIYTMAHCLRACARHGIPAIVCDRPNPINGVDVEGTLLVPGFESFVGQFPIPMRHGMTIGELALLFNRHFRLGAHVEVVRMEGWRREMFWDDTDVPWVMPSPNMPTLDTAIVYPGTVLLEGTLLSEGRGTTRPFEIVGAPGVEAEHCARTLNALNLPGVYFRPVGFEPTFQKHARTPCGGCQIHVLDRNTFSPVLTGVAIVHAFRQFDVNAELWRHPPYEYERTKMPFDILSGSGVLRDQIESGEPPSTIAASWETDEDAFRELRAPYLLY